MVSHKYGFGLINASAAVQMATDTEYLRMNAPFGVKAIRSEKYRNITYNRDTFIGQDNFFYERSNLGEFSMSGRVLRVQVRVTLDHPALHHLKIMLVSPSGTTSVLANVRQVDLGEVTPYRDYSMSTLRHWGEDPRGNWTILIEDVLGGEIFDPSKVSLMWLPTFFISSFLETPSPSPSPTPTLPPTPTPFIHTDHNVTLSWLFNDPFFPDQWHLHDPLGGEHSPFMEYRSHINVFPAWRAGHTGRGVTIAVLDDGIDATQPDLVNQFSVLTSCDTSTWGEVRRGTHGTLIASLISAEANNTFCGVGKKEEWCVCVCVCVCVFVRV